MRCACQGKPSGEGITERRVKIAIACGAYLSDDWGEAFLDRVDRKVVRCHPAANFQKSGVSEVTHAVTGRTRNELKSQAVQSMAWQRDADGGHVAPERDTQGQHSTGTPCEEALVLHEGPPLPSQLHSSLFCMGEESPVRSRRTGWVPWCGASRGERGRVGQGKVDGGRWKATCAIGREDSEGRTHALNDG